MKVKIFRFNPNIDKEAYFEIFEVPIYGNDTWTVMDVLDYILRNYDCSLSYYRHSICNHGICGRCLIKVNGKVCLACIHKVSNNDDLLIEPVPNKKIIKDLVTE